MRNMVFTIIFISFVTSLSCFRRQEHEVDEPTWPRYVVEGIILDSLTKKPVDSCIVTIERGGFLYFGQDNFTSDSDTTDSNGVFLIDSVAPGLLFPINFEKEDCYCPHTDTIDVFIFPSDTLNCCYRYALVSLVDVPHIAISDSVFELTLKRGTSRDFTLIIFNKGALLPLYWNLPVNVEWLVVNPDSGSVPAQGSQDITLQFNAVFDGIIRTQLCIESNDCYASCKRMFVRFVVL